MEKFDDLTECDTATEMEMEDWRGLERVTRSDVSMFGSIPVEEEEDEEDEEESMTLVGAPERSGNSS